MNNKDKLDILGEFLLSWRIRTVRPHIQGRLLDIGCGTNRLVKTYGNGAGIDVYRFGNADLIIKDTSNLPFDSESFDTVTFIATVNHIPLAERERILKEVRRVLKPNGAIVITMISPFISKIWHLLRSPWDRDQKERGMKEGESYGIKNKDIRSFLQKSGFSVVKSKRFMFFINNFFVAKKTNS